jgi:hypothetical protein
MLFKKLFTLLMCVLVSFSVFAWKGQAAASKVSNAGRVARPDEPRVGVYYGQIELKTAASKRTRNRTVVLQIRNRSTKKLVARTTAESSGKFKFENIRIQKGLEIGWAVPELDDGPIGEDGCYQLLPFDYTTLEPIEECDDSVMVLRTGLSNCTVPPCPWEKELTEIRNTGRN